MALSHSGSLSFRRSELYLWETQNCVFQVPLVEGWACFYMTWFLKTVPVEHSLNYLLLTVGIDLGGSQTRRIAEVGRHNSRWFSTILPVQLEHVGQDLVQLGFESPSMETPQPFWAAILAVKKPLLVFRQCKILYLKGFFFFFIHFMPIASCPFTGHRWGESATVICLLPIVVCKFLMDMHYCPRQPWFKALLTMLGSLLA